MSRKQGGEDYKILCRWSIFWLKKGIKHRTQELSRAWSEYKLISREIRLLQARNSPFDQHRFEQLEAERRHFGALLDSIEGGVIECAEILKQLLDTYDLFSTFSAKAAIIGISTIALRRKLIEYNKAKDTEKIGLYSMIMVYHAEWLARRCERDSVPTDKNRMPLFWGFLARMAHLSRTDPSYRAIADRAFIEASPGLPMFMVYPNADGTSRRIPIPQKPPLYIVPDQQETN